jgi:hypothetical protein
MGGSDLADTHSMKHELQTRDCSGTSSYDGYPDVLQASSDIQLERETAVDCIMPHGQRRHASVCWYSFISPKKGHEMRHKVQTMSSSAVGRDEWRFDFYGIKYI